MKPRGRSGAVWRSTITPIETTRNATSVPMLVISARKSIGNTAASNEMTQATMIVVGTGVSVRGFTFRKIDGMWVWTNADGVWRYSELDDDGTTTVAVSKGTGAEGQDIYVRFPNAGGQGFQSYDEQDNWRDGVIFTVVKS